MIHQRKRYTSSRKIGVDSRNTTSLDANSPGFRMVAGNTANRNMSDTAEQQAISFAYYGQEQTNYLPSTTAKCTDILRLQVYFVGFYVARYNGH